MECVTCYIYSFFILLLASKNSPTTHLHLLCSSLCASIGKAGCAIRREWADQANCVGYVGLYCPIQFEIPEFRLGSGKQDWKWECPVKVDHSGFMGNQNIVQKCDQL